MWNSHFGEWESSQMWSGVGIPGRAEGQLEILWLRIAVKLVRNVGLKRKFYKIMM